MKGVCKIINSLGVPTHVVVKDQEGKPFTMSIEEYMNQGILPHVADLPVCAE